MTADRLLLTRPEPQARRFASACRDRFGADFSVTISPMQRIAPNASFPDLSAARGLIVSSENAARLLVDSQQAPGLPIWCVGHRSADGLRAAGWTVAAVARDATALATLILADRPSGPLVHLSGAHVAADIVGNLSSNGVEARREIVYEQVAAPLNAEGRRMLRDAAPVLLALFSPRSARLLASELLFAGGPLRVAAMSHAVAAEVAVQAGTTIEVARAPNAEAMLEVLTSLREG